jgi:hypothetical protein
MPVVLKKQIPFTVQIDGQDVRLFIKRMTVEEYAEFAAEFLARNKQQHAPSESIVRSRADQARRDTEDALEYAHWICGVFGKFVTVQAGDLQLDTAEITSGEEFARVLAGYDDVVATVLAQVYLANRVSAAQKKTSSLPSGSATGSAPVLSLAGNGTAPETTAASAAPKASAPSAPVSDLPASASSGTTDPSPSAFAPSGS